MPAQSPWLRVISWVSAAFCFGWVLFGAGGAFVSGCFLWMNYLW